MIKSTVILTPESKLIRFPLTQNSGNRPSAEGGDLIIAPKDLKGTFVSYSKLAAVAHALLAKREYVAQWMAGIPMDDEGEGWGLSSPVFAGHPEVTLFIDGWDLNGRERPSKHGRLLAELMREICIQNDVKKRSAIHTLIHTLNEKVINSRTCLYRLGLLDNCLVVIDTTERFYSLQIGAKCYDALPSPGMKIRTGFSNLGLQQIAAAGVNGLPPAHLHRKVAGNELNRNSLWNQASLATSFFRSREPTENICLRYTGHTLYMLDSSQPDHVEKARELDAKTKSSRSMASLLGRCALMRKREATVGVT